MWYSYKCPDQSNPQDHGDILGSNFIMYGVKAIQMTNGIAEKFNLRGDAKHIVWQTNSNQLIHTMRKTYSYGLLFHAFQIFYDKKDKHCLRDDIQKCQTLMRNEFGIKDEELLP